MKVPGNKLSKVEAEVEFMNKVGLSTTRLGMATPLFN
jgi:hypothetical protein